MDLEFITHMPNIWVNRGALKVLPHGLESWDGDWWRRYFPGEPDCLKVSAYRVFEEPLVVDGVEIYYHWDLAGPDGASFLLFLGPDCTAEHVRKAKRKLRDDRDVVHFSTFRATSIDWLDAPAFA